MISEILMCRHIFSRTPHLKISWKCVQRFSRFYMRSDRYCRANTRIFGTVRYERIKNKSDFLAEIWNRLVIDKVYWIGGTHSGACEGYHHLVVTSSSSVEVHQCFGEAYRLRPQGRRISQAINEQNAGSKCSVCCLVLADFCLAYFQTLKMEAICSSETSVDRVLYTEDHTFVRGT
jgi:hypothetical protein